MIRVFGRYVSPKAIALVAMEATLIFLSLLSAVKLRFWNSVTDFEVYTAMPGFAIQVAVIVVVCLTCLNFNDLYDLTVARRRGEQWILLEQALGAAGLVLGLAYFV